MVILCLLFSSTFPFRAGLLGELTSKFRHVWIIFTYLCLTVAVCIYRFTLIESGKFIWEIWEPGYHALSTIHKLCK